MTVVELIKQLQGMPGHYEVALSESGFIFPLSDLDSRDDRKTVVLWG